MKSHRPQDKYSDPVGSQRTHWRVLRVATISLWATLLLARGDLELANAVIIILILLMIASLVAQRLKRLPPMWETQVWSLGQEDPLEKEMASHPSILAWRIPWMEEPGRLQSMGSQRVGHDWATSPHFTSLMIASCIINSLTNSVSVQVNKLQNIALVQQGYIKLHPTTEYITHP